MNAADNKAIIQRVFDELAAGNGRPFIDALGEDILWRIIGSTDWSGTWEGKAAVRERLLEPPRRTAGRTGTPTATSAGSRAARCGS